MSTRPRPPCRVPVRGCGTRGRWRGLAEQRSDAPSHTSVHYAPLVWRAPEGLEGPGCGARGRWRGLAGLRGDAPSEARGADDSRAGRRPRAHQAARHAHQAARPNGAGNAAPGTPVGPQAARHTQPGTQRTQQGARSASAPRAPRVSVAHRLSWMLRPGTASISSRV